MNIEPVILEGEFVRLEPLRVDHLPALCHIGLDSTIWQWSPTEIRNEGDMESYVRDALTAQSHGTAIPFVTVEMDGGTVVGSTRFANIDTPNRKVEIGWTWLDPKWQRTVINTEAKLLMLTHAFEHWKCIRVELKTDANNLISQTAIARIGAKKEGVLRNHIITATGRFRDSVYFSIVESEWETVKAELASKIRQGA